MDKQCEKQVTDPQGGFPHRCHRKAKDIRDGKWLCGQHVAAVDRRVRKNREWREQWDADNRHKDYLRELSEKHDFRIGRYFMSNKHKYSHTEVVVNLEDLKNLLGQDERLRKEAELMRSKSGSIQRFIVANRILNALDPEES